MYTRKIFIKKYHWQVEVFYGVTCEDVETVLEAMQHINAPERVLQLSHESITKCRYNTGNTYSNPMLRSSVMSIGKASSPSEFFNTFNHEKNHLVEHIAMAFSLKSAGEGEAYLDGHISEQLFEDVKQFICNCPCHKKQDA